MKMIKPHSESVGVETGGAKGGKGGAVTTTVSFRALQVFVTGALLASPL